MSTTPARVTRWVAFTLRWGAYLSAALLLVGAAWVAMAADVPIQAGPPMPFGALPAQLAEHNPYAIMQAGVLLLLLTPLLRIVVAAVSFWGEGERRYTLIALAVLAIIVGSWLLAQRGG